MEKIDVLDDIDGTGFIFDDDDWGGYLTCDWDEDYCPEKATHQIRWEQLEDGDVRKGMLFFCGRHYALYLVRQALVDDLDSRWSWLDMPGFGTME